MTLHLHPDDLAGAHAAARDAAGSPWWQRLLYGVATGAGATLIGLGAWLKAKANRLNRRIDRSSIVPHDPTPAAALRTHEEVREAVHDAVLDERTHQRLSKLERDQQDTSTQLTAYFRKHDADSRRLQRLKGRILGLQTSAAAQEMEARILAAIYKVGLDHAASMQKHLEDHHSDKNK